MKVYNKHLLEGVDEMRRVGTLVNKVRRLIELSQEGVPLSREEKADRKQVQDEIELLVAGPLSKVYIDLGKSLEHIANGEGGACMEIVTDVDGEYHTLGD